MRPCSRCGQPFDPPATRGRPRTRCDDCRSHHEKIDGKRWRDLRKTLLAGDPVCSVPGCRRPATQLDHIVPLAKGGDPYDLYNLRPICGPCNSSKAARSRNGLPPANVPARSRDTWASRVTAGRGAVVRVEEHGNARTTHYADGTSHTETAMKW